MIRARPLHHAAPPLPFWLGASAVAPLLYVLASCAPGAKVAELPR